MYTLTIMKYLANITPLCTVEYALFYYTHMTSPLILRYYNCVYVCQLHTELRPLI